MTVHETDVAIVGAGPVGLFAIFECGMLKIRSQVIDTLEVIGGQCAALYPEKPIYDIPGYPKIMAAELIGRLAEQAAPFDPVYHLGQQVMSVSARGERWLVETSTGARIDTRAIVIAAGCGAFVPNRPPLPGIEDYEDKSVFYMVQRRDDFHGKRIVIAGGGDSALDWVLSLADLAEKIYVVHRRPKFRAVPESVKRMHALAGESDRVEVVTPYQLHGLEGRGGQLEAVVVATLEGETRRLEADVLLPFFGLTLSLGPIADWGLNVARNMIAVDPSNCMTNAPGIFAVGDIADYPGKLKLILSGFSEAAMAAHAIYGLVHPDQELHWEYSTIKGVSGLG